MRAKTVDEMNQVPFSNANRNQPISQAYPLRRLQYEDADKRKKTIKRNKKIKAWKRKS